MAILNNDIKVFQSQDNTDNDSGGGSRTASEVVDGDVNNLFSDISRIDTVSGSVSLRKIFPTVDTLNNDIYYGAHAMLRKTPSDPKVSALMFYGNDPHEKRASVQNKIESYLVASYLEQFYLYGNHTQGGKSITFLMQNDGVPPDVGEVYLLKEQANSNEQYVRIVSTNIQVISLTYNVNNAPTSFSRTRIICEIDQPLEYQFTGSEFEPTGQQLNTANTFATQIADAATFYSTKTLSVNATSGDQVLTVDSIFEQLVPASVTQIPIVNESGLKQGDNLLSMGTPIVKSQVLTGSETSISLGRPITPNSISSFYTTNYIDDGKGNLVHKDTLVKYGVIDYRTGYISNYSLGVAGTIGITYTPAMLIDSDIQYTTGIKITQENKGLVYVVNLSPIPSNGDLYVDYRSNGKWYRFHSNFDNTLGDDSNIGAGLLNDNGDGTGTLSLTLGALPDLDSTIIISWGSSKRFTSHTSQISETSDSGVNVVTKPASTTAVVEIDLGQENIVPSSFNLNHFNVVEGQFRNITCDNDGILVDTESASYNRVQGTLDLANGKLSLTTGTTSNKFNLTGSANNLTIDYDAIDSVSDSAQDYKTKVLSKTPQAGELQLTENTGVVTFSLGEAIADPYSLDLRLMVKSGRTVPQELAICCINEAGTPTLRFRGQFARSAPLRLSGTINLSTGDVSITMTRRSHKELNPSYAGVHGGIPKYLVFEDAFWELGNHDSSIKYRVATPVAPTVSTYQIVDKTENLMKYKIKTVPDIVGEIDFNFTDNSNTANVNFYSAGSVIYDYTGLARGIIDKAKGEIEISYTNHYMKDLYLNFRALYTNEINDYNFRALYTNNLYSETVDELYFRTSATKLTTSSLQIRYETSVSSYIATSDQNGVLTGTNVDSVNSYVDTKTGMVKAVFTAPIMASSVMYDAVAESSLPLDPELLGLNPVRLPSDGRVPVFKAGSHLVIYNEVTTAVVNGTPVADQVDTLARTGQAFIEVVDANGKRLNPTAYTADRTAGTVTFANPLVLQDKYNAALTAPYSIVDRVEDMLLATDVQINGVINLSGGLSRNYTQGDTYVASSLVWGNTGSRVFNLFAQEIWNSGNPVWSDALIGDPTTSQYDEINYPLQINNRSSVSGRWAIIFKSATSVDVVEENLGVVQANISISIDDVAPINPATGQAYFTMLKEGFGSGWVTNNVLRFNTDSGDNDMWIIRTVQSGALSELTDSIELEVRGDAN